MCRLERNDRENVMDIDKIIESKIMRLNTTERKLVWAMIRNKSDDGLRWCEIPLEEFCMATGKSSGSCSRTIQYLAKHELITVRKVRLGSSFRNQFKLIPLEQN